PPSCSGVSDCAAQGFDGVCRLGVCRADVPCKDDVECALSEACRPGGPSGKRCVFTGCTDDSQCGSGRCRKDVFTSTECPATRPICELDGGHCVQCRSDDECAPPLPGYCETGSGTCIYCKTDSHCPNGLTCGADGVCRREEEPAVPRRHRLRQRADVHQLRQLAALLRAL